MSVQSGRRSVIAAVETGQRNLFRVALPATYHSAATCVSAASTLTAENLNSGILP